MLSKLNVNSCNVWSNCEICSRILNLDAKFCMALTYQWIYHFQNDLYHDEEVENVTNNMRNLPQSFTDVVEEFMTIRLGNQYFVTI